MKEKIKTWITTRDWISFLKKTLMLFLMMFVIPISSSFLFGYNMQAKQIQNIPTVIVDKDGSSFSRMITEEIRSNEIFDIVSYSQQDSDIQNLIEQNKARVGMIIPSSFSKDLKEGKGPKVLVFYDGSQMSMTSAAKARMTEILLTIKTGFLKKVMEGKLNILPKESIKTVTPMYFSYRLLNNPTRNYVSFLIPGMLIAIIQVGLVMIGVERVREKEKYFTLYFLKSLIWGILGAVSIVLTIWIQCHYFGVPYRGTVEGGLKLTLLYSLGMISFGMLVKLIIPNKLLATQVAAILVLPSSILGGYTFPLMSMPKVFQQIGECIPYVHYAEPLRDLCMKPIDISYIATDMNWLAKFVVWIWIASAVVFFTKKIVKILWNKLSEKKQQEQNVKAVA
ncbi:ABC transporter permease [Clostridium ganghwense]|uniref:ABC transporter permease n=1 Tax=Clostridium ganghwense TaxID=312089 RepID=A0ABT4CUQ0_9CLOT|nr:ABC transporter permease [Clostridium ganghwense]MCY6372810.1 ABC transporter permease [Clostridium ganghwense]